MLFTFMRVENISYAKFKVFLSARIVHHLLQIFFAVLLLQIYQTGILFIYTIRFVGDRGDEGEVERS